MEDLIKALQIFLKYENKEYPTHCEHDELIVYIKPSKVSNDDIQTLEELGFYTNIDEGYFYSFKYGSC